MSKVLSVMAGWVASHVPTRETVEANRWLRPFAHQVLRSELWRFNRRSVPRAVALGAFLSLLVPFAHMVLASLLAVIVRANVPIAFVTAGVVGNPLTYLVVYPLAYRLGHFLLHLDKLTGLAPIASTMAETGSGSLLERLTGKGLEAAFGILVEASVLAVVGYLVASLVWRLRITRKRRGRLDASQARTPE